MVAGCALGADVRHWMFKEEGQHGWSTRRPFNQTSSWLKKQIPATVHSYLLSSPPFLSLLPPHSLSFLDSHPVLHISQLDSLLSKGHLVLFQSIFHFKVNWLMCKSASSSSVFFLFLFLLSTAIYSVIALFLHHDAFRAFYTPHMSACIFHPCHNIAFSLPHFPFPVCTTRTKKKSKQFFSSFFHSTKKKLVIL